MPYWYEVFDNEEVQLLTRRQAGQLSGIAVSAVVLTLSLLALAHAGAVPLALSGGPPDRRGLDRRRAVDRRQAAEAAPGGVVREALGPGSLSATTTPAQKTALDWTKVARVELAGRGLTVFGPPPCSFEIPHLFPDFAELSHRVLFYAEFYDVPVFIDGQPLQELDVYALYPFLLEGSSPGSPGAASGPASA